MGKPAKISVVGDTKVARAINGTIMQLKRLGHATAKVGRAMRGIGTGIAKGMRIAAVGILGAVAASAALLKVYSAQQDAEAALFDSLEKTGDATAANVDNFKKLATELQGVTVHGDEVILAQITMAHNMGITTDRLEDATKAAIGLAARYKLDLATTMKLVAKANAGQTGELSRYGIVLDATLSPAEKFNALLKIGGSSMSFAETEAARLSGRFKQVKNSIGDMLERFGKLISTALDLENRFDRIRIAVDELGARMDKDKSIEKWAASARVPLEIIENLIKSIFSGGAEAGKAFGDIGKLIKFAFVDAAILAGNKLMEIAPIVGDLIAKGFQAASPFTGGDKAQAEKELMDEGVIKKKKRGFMFGLEFGTSGTESALIQRRMERNRNAVLTPPQKQADSLKTFIAQLEKRRSGGGVADEGMADIVAKHKAEQQAISERLSQTPTDLPKYLTGVAGGASGDLPGMFGKIINASVRANQRRVEVGEKARAQVDRAQQRAIDLRAAEAAKDKAKNAIDLSGITRTGVDMGRLFDVKQFGFGGGVGELGTKNNPMHAVIEKRAL